MPDGLTSPLIKSDDFPKSPLSPHLKLKELARRKSTLSPIINRLSTEESALELNHDGAENVSMAEEAGLTVPPTQP